MADPTLDTLPWLTDWISQQRWFAGKSRRPRFRQIGALSLPSDQAGVRVLVLLLLDEAEEPLLYQVPITVRERPLEAEPAISPPPANDEADAPLVYDGPRDPAYARALLGAILGESSLTSATARADGHRQPGGEVGAVTSSHVLRGEQSNTSIIFELEPSETGPAQLICKVFRALHHGENPDVVLQSAIAAAGSNRVPRSFGSLRGQWSDSGRADGVARGHLAFAQEFLPGTEDAWRVALRAVQSGEDFSGPAHALGESTAEVHKILAEAFPQAEPAFSARAGTLASMRARLEAAIRSVPSIAEHRGAIEIVLGRVESGRWPRLQRIHGDYHLGQVLLVPERGWVLLDFEGEPLRPMEERSQPDLALRDVAGMLRSFDYAAGSAERDLPADSPARTEVGDWAKQARAAFLAGYERASGVPLADSQLLLGVLELDKALYETVYEAKNRPGWLSIPTDAIARLVEALS